jgi:hypothetical protein
MKYSHNLPPTLSPSPATNDTFARAASTSARAKNTPEIPTMTTSHQARATTHQPPAPNHQPSASPRAAANRANSLRSTGPRTGPGKHRSSLNALRHGLTARTAVLPTEDPDAYRRHLQQFLDEYAPATPTETQLVREIADTAWRLNRIPLLEAELLARASHPTPTFDIVDAHRLLATLGLHGSRLSRQFQKALDQLRDIQEQRRHIERRQLTEAAQLFLRHQRKAVPFDPSDLGFVFSKEQIERHARKLILQNPAFYAPIAPTPIAKAANGSGD